MAKKRNNCKVCKEPIKNKQVHAVRCKTCEQPLHWIHQRIGNWKRAFNKKFPDYQLKVSCIKKKNV